MIRCLMETDSLLSLAVMVVSVVIASSTLQYNSSHRCLKWCILDGVAHSARLTRSTPTVNTKRCLVLKKTCPASRGAKPHKKSARIGACGGREKLWS